MTLFGKRVFADVVKLRILRSSWIILVGPKSSDKCSYKRHPVEDIRTREGHVKSEAETEVMQPQAKECLEPPEARRGLRAFRRNRALPTP